MQVCAWFISARGGCAACRAVILQCGGGSWPLPYTVQAPAVLDRTWQGLRTLRALQALQALQAQVASCPVFSPPPWPGHPGLPPVHPVAAIHLDPGCPLHLYHTRDSAMFNPIPLPSHSTSHTLHHFLQNSRPSLSSRVTRQLVDLDIPRPCLDSRVLSFPCSCALFAAGDSDHDPRRTRFCKAN